MTIASQTSRIAYTGDGVTTVFAVPFYFAANADLVAILQDTLGNQVVQVLGTNYNLTGATLSAGGTCTFTVAPTTGYLVTVYRDPAATQTTSYNNNDPFPAKSHELALDKLTTLVQRLKDQVSRTIHQTEGEPTMVTALGTIAARKNRMFGFDTNGVPVYAVGPTFTSNTYVGVADVDSRASASVTTFPISVNIVRTNGYTTPGDGGGAVYTRGIISSPGAFQDAGGVYWGVSNLNAINVKQFGAKGDGVTNDAVAIQAAITAAAGAEVYLPAGTFVLTAQVSYITAVNFVSGLRLRGAGPAKTFIDNRVANNACILSSGGTNLFQFGGYVKDLTIKTTTNPVVSHGIEHKAAYQYTVENVYVTGLSGDAMRVSCALGDSDASNEMWYKNCRMENCDIGLNCNFATTVVQPSFMRVDSCFFQANRIGWRYIGLSATMINSCFTIHTAIALQIVNNAASNAQFSSIGTSFENNLVSIQIDSLQGGTFIQTELASGAGGTPVATKAVVINAGIGIKFEGTRVRISNNPHTLWTFAAGATATGNQICNSFYQNYDAIGQVRYLVDSSNFGNRLDDSWDSIQIGTAVGVSGVTCVNGANQNLAIPIDGAAFTLSGPSGAFNIGGFTNGFTSRKMILRNSTGQTATFNAEDAGSTASNRIRTETSANVTLNNGGAATFLYDAGVGRWQFLGKG